MTRFRPCIDLHSGQVKQIVGGTLNGEASDLRTNYVSSNSAGHYASLYRKWNLTGTHVIMLGPGNEEAAKEAIAAWPDRLQVGGGINAENAPQWIAAGADKVGHDRAPCSPFNQSAKTELIAIGHYHILSLSRRLFFSGQTRRLSCSSQSRHQQIGH